MKYDLWEMSPWELSKYIMRKKIEIPIKYYIELEDLLIKIIEASQND